MAEPTQPTATNPAAEPSAAQTPPAAPAAGDMDLSKLDAAQLEKVLENKNLWHLPRIRELREAKDSLDKLLSEKKTADEKAMAENNQHKELAELRTKELTDAQAKIQEMSINQSLLLKLQGVVDVDAALKLIDRSKITVDANGSVQGIDEAISTLKADKAYLFTTPGTTRQQLGGAANSGTQGGAPMKFTRSQIKDSAFYKEHQAEIIKAAAAGLIEDDISR